jgi:hypothetical protein
LRVIFLVVVPIDQFVVHVVVRFSRTLLFMSCETSLETRLAEKKFFQLVLTISLIFGCFSSTFVVENVLHVQLRGVDCEVDTVKFRLPPDFFFVVGRDKTLTWKMGQR